MEQEVEGDDVEDLLRIRQSQPEDTPEQCLDASIELASLWSVS